MLFRGQPISWVPPVSLFKLLRLEVKIYQQKKGCMQIFFLIINENIINKK